MQMVDMLGRQRIVRLFINLTRWIRTVHVLRLLPPTPPAQLLVPFHRLSPYPGDFSILLLLLVSKVRASIHGIIQTTMVFVDKHGVLVNCIVPLYQMDNLTNLCMLAYRVSLTHTLLEIQVLCLQLMKLATSKVKWKSLCISEVSRRGLQFLGNTCKSSLMCMACCNTLYYLVLFVARAWRSVKFMSAACCYLSMGPLRCNFVV